MRRWTRALALGAAAAALVAGPTISVGAQSHEHPPGGGEGLLPPGDWSDEQEATLLDLIARTEAELPAFDDPAELLEMGFIDFGVSAPGFPGEGAGYDHFINWDWIDDDHILDPTRPESLVFRVTWDDETFEPTYELVSAMFFLPSQYGLDDMPEEWAWYPGWHTHENICVGEDYTFAGLTSDGTCPPGSRVFDKPPMMHVWIQDNPCGHRFGGIDVGGPHCDVHGHPGGPGGPTTTHPHGPTTTHPHGPTTTHPHGPTTTHPHGPTTTHPHGPTTSHPPGGGGGHDHDPPAATPIHRHPDHAG